MPMYNRVRQICVGSAFVIRFTIYTCPRTTRSTDGSFIDHSCNALIVARSSSLSSSAHSTSTKRDAQPPHTSSLYRCYLNDAIAQAFVCTWQWWMTPKCTHTNTHTHKCKSSRTSSFSLQPNIITPTIAAARASARVALLMSHRNKSFQLNSVSKIAPYIHLRAHNVRFPFCGCVRVYVCLVLYICPRP